MSLMSGCCCKPLLEVCDRSFYYIFSMELNYNRQLSGFDYNPEIFLNKQLTSDRYAFGFRAYQSGVCYMSTRGRPNSSLPTGFCSLRNTSAEFEGYVNKKSTYADWGTNESYTTYKSRPNPFEYFDETQIQDQPPQWRGGPFIIPSIDGFITNGSSLIERAGPSLRTGRNINRYQTSGAYRPYSYCGYAGVPDENYTQLSKFDEDDRPEVRDSVYAFREHNAYTIGGIMEQSIFGVPDAVQIGISGFSNTPFDPNPVVYRPLTFRREYDNPITGAGVDTGRTYWSKMFRNMEDHRMGSMLTLSGQIPKHFYQRQSMLASILNPADYQLDNLGNHNCIDNGGVQNEVITPQFCHLGWNDVFDGFRPATGYVGGGSSTPNPNLFRPQRNFPGEYYISQCTSEPYTGPDPRAMVSGCSEYYDDYHPPSDEGSINNLWFDRLSQNDALTQLGPGNGGINYNTAGRMVIQNSCDSNGIARRSYANYLQRLSGYVDLTIVPQEYDWSGNGTLCPDQEWSPEG